MSSKRIKFEWKDGVRPSSEARATMLKEVAYQTAIAYVPDVRVILIRSDIHGTTMVRRVKQVDASGPHITISCKNAHHFQTNTHLTFHGYANGYTNPKVVRVKPGDPNGVPNKDQKPSVSGTIVWPSTGFQTPSETVDVSVSK